VIFSARGSLYASHEKSWKKFLDAQVKGKKVKTIVLYVHLTPISVTTKVGEQIWVFAREIVIITTTALPGYTVSNGKTSTRYLGAKARGQLAKITAFL